MRSHADEETRSLRTKFTNKYFLIDRLIVIAFLCSGNLTGAKHIDFLNFNPSGMNLQPTPSLEIILEEDDVWSSHNQKLRDWFFTEPSEFFPLTASLIEFIDNKRYASGMNWWIGGPAIGEFSSESSRSLLKLLIPENGTREVYWPTGFGGEPDISEFRISVNYDQNGQEHSLEIFFKDPETKEPTPFMLIYKDDSWVPVSKLEGQHIQEVCASCHRDSQGRMVSFPLAIFGNELDLEESGYYQSFYKDLMDPRHLW